MRFECALDVEALIIDSVYARVHRSLYEAAKSRSNLITYT